MRQISRLLTLAIVFTQTYASPAFDPTKKPGAVTIKQQGTEPRGSRQVTIGWEKPVNCNQEYPCTYEVSVATKGGQPGKADRTMALSYTYDQILSGRPYTFRVRAVNSCGEGEWCNMTYRTCAAPDKPVLVQVKQSKDCNEILVRWQAPVKSEFFGAHDSYTLDIEDVRGRYVNFKKCNGRKNTCRILTSDLKGNVWKLRTGSKVKIQVKACNLCGKGKESLGNVCTLKAQPPLCTQPKGVCESGQTFTVSWAPVANAQVGQTYELYWDAGMNGQFQGRPLMPPSNKTSFNVKKIKGACQYMFKVRAVTPCGKGKFSPVLRINCQQKIEAPKVVAGAPDGCSIKIQWQPVVNECTPITHYSVEVVCNGQYTTWAQCGRLETNTCIIPMAKLSGNGFAEGSEISVRVAAHAGNKYRSNYARPQGPRIAMVGAPPRMIKPKAEFINDGKRVKVCWQSPGARSDLSYEVFAATTDSATADNPMADFKKIAKTDSLCTEMNAVPNARSYRFFVRACNKCGYGPISNQFMVEVEGAGCDPKNPESSCYHDPEEHAKTECTSMNPFDPCYETSCDPTDPTSPCYQKNIVVDNCNPSDPSSPCYIEFTTDPDPVWEAALECNPADPESSCYHEQDSFSECNPSDPDSPCYQQVAEEDWGCDPTDAQSPCYHEPAGAPVIGCDPSNPASPCYNGDYDDPLNPVDTKCDPADPRSPCYAGDFDDWNNNNDHWNQPDNHNDNDGHGHL